MSNIKVSDGSLDKAIADAIGGVDAAVMLATKDAAKKAADYTVRELKAKSPKGATGRYAKSWKTKAQDGGQVVYNDKHYRLTHLLENGHDIVHDGKKVGRAKAYPHIKRCEQDGIEQFELWLKAEVNRRLST